VRRLAWGVVPVLVAMLSGCTPTTAPPAPPSSTPTPAPSADLRTCRQSRPAGWLPPRPDGSKPFGTFFSLGRTDTNQELSVAPACTRSLHIEVDRLGAFTPSGRTEVDGRHRHYREYRIVVTNLLPHTVWFVDQSVITAFDGGRPADRAIDLVRRIGVPPSDDLAVGHQVHWREAFSDDQGNPSVLVTPVLGGTVPIPVGTSIFSDH
jgi:hypothetical protein